MNHVPGSPIIRWRRPGIRRELPSKLNDWDASIACDGPSPGTSARNRHMDERLYQVTFGAHQ
jgi:hypothetical protein